MRLMLYRKEGDGHSIQGGRTLYTEGGGWTCHTLGNQRFIWRVTDISYRGGRTPHTGITDASYRGDGHFIQGGRTLHKGGDGHFIQSYWSFFIMLFLLLSALFKGACNTVLFVLGTDCPKLGTKKLTN